MLSLLFLCFVFSSYTAVSAQPFFASALTGSWPCGFVATAQLGPTTFKLLVDTGSSSTLVASSQCQSMDGCGGITPLYVTTATSPATTGKYGDGTFFFGVGVFDTFGIGGSTVSSSFKFAAVTAASLTPPFWGFPPCVRNSYQGILGLAFPSLLFPATQDAVIQTGLAGYALQLCPSGGNFFGGGVDTTYLTSKVLWVPLFPSSLANPSPAPAAQQGYLTTQVDFIKVAGKQLALLQTGAYSTWIWDSGTSPLTFAAQSDYLVFGTAMSTSGILACPSCSAAMLASFWTGQLVLLASKVTINPNIPVQVGIWNGGVGNARADTLVNLYVPALFVISSGSPSTIYFNVFYTGSGTLNILPMAAFIGNVILVNVANASLGIATGQSSKCAVAPNVNNFNYVFNQNTSPNSAVTIETSSMTFLFMIVVFAVMFG